MTNEELVALLDHRFEHIDQRFERIDQRFEHMDQQFERVDQRFERIDQRFERMDQRFERMDQRFDELKTDVRHAHVRIENLDTTIRQVAEGVVNVEQKLDRFRKETGENFEDLRERVTVIERARR